MAIEQFIASIDLWEVFTDKDQLTFLNSGYILFFRDSARTIGKPVYMITGTPGSYTFIPYGFFDLAGAWRVNLNDQGALDNALYYFPFDNTNAIDLYFIQVYSSGNVLQFSREGWPPGVVSNQTGTTVTQNFIANPQFVLFNDVPPTSSTKAGQITQGITDIAPGGWTFERPSLSTATDFVERQRFGSYTTTPPGNPRFALRVNTQIPSAGDTFKDVRLKFNDVNRFSSSTMTYTFAFESTVNAGLGLSVQFLIVKNFGTGGSPTVEVPIATFNITNSWQQYVVSFVLGANTGQTIGPLDDDFVQLAIRLPTDTVLDISFDDLIFLPGNVSTPNFPEFSDETYVYESLAGYTPIPDPLGFNLGLPILLGLEGFVYDLSQVGKVFPCVYQVAQFGELLCDGTTYQTANYSSDGIPYARLQEVLFNPSTNFPMFGTGSTYLSNFIDYTNLPSTMIISTNSAGSVTATADGSIPTGFTFGAIHTGNVSYTVGYFAGNNAFYFRTINPGIEGINAGTSGFTFTSARLNNVTNPYNQVYYGIVSVFPAAGSYFAYLVNNGSSDVQYYIWYKVNGAGSDPAPGGTGLEVDLLSTYSQQDVAILTAQALSGSQISSVTTNAGSAMTGGTFFNVSTTTNNYYVWYTVNGVGTDPAPAGRLAIPVAVLTTDTSTLTALKTQFAMNTKYFAVPDLRGKFIRGWDNGAGFDPDTLVRMGFNPSNFGDAIGTLQFDMYTDPQVIATAELIVSTTSALVNIGTDFEAITSITQTPLTLGGGNETRPVNMYMNYVIKY